MLDFKYTQKWGLTNSILTPMNKELFCCEFFDASILIRFGINLSLDIATCGLEANWATFIKLLITRLNQVSIY